MTPLRKQLVDALSEIGLVEVNIISWELDDGELGIEFVFAGGTHISHRVPVPDSIKSRLTRCKKPS